MRQSETIGKLAAALSKAQAAVQPAKKDATNPFFKSKYADLESVWEACREALTKNELSVVQSTDIMLEQVCLITMLAHSSGEWVRSVMPLMMTKQDPQSMGSAMSYARRYALAGMVGIVQSDDDAEKAMAPTRPSSVKHAPAKAPNLKKNDPEKLTLAQKDILVALLQSNAAEVKADQIASYYKVKKITDIPSESFDRAVKALDKANKEADGQSTMA